MRESRDITGQYSSRVRGNHDATAGMPWEAEAVRHKPCLVNQQAAMHGHPVAAHSPVAGRYSPDPPGQWPLWATSPAAALETTRIHRVAGLTALVTMRPRPR
jgi:hypothetical protein